MSAGTVVRGAVAHGQGGVEIVDVWIPEPQGREVRIRVEACGLCHSDLHYIHGSSGTDFPYLVGHEVVGTVESVGANVTRVATGQRVIVCLMTPCGECSACQRDKKTRCPNKLLSVTAPSTVEGDILAPVLGVGGLAELVLVDEAHVAEVPGELSVELAALLGCGVTTGFGAAVNTGEVSPGDRVAVIGAGGVGLASIVGARAAGAVEVLAVDVNKDKLAEAERFGATSTALAGDAEQQAGTDGTFDVVIDAVGGAATMKRSFELAGVGGRVVVAGAPAQGELGDLDLRLSFLRRHEMAVSHWGDTDTATDFPRMAELVASGDFPLARYVTETIGIDDVPAAFERLEKGLVVRSVVVFPRQH